MRYSIQTAVPEDGVDVTALLQTSYPNLMKTAYEPELLSAALYYMTRAKPELLSSGTFFIARSAENHIVACGGWTKENPDGAPPEKGVGHIRHFATHPDWTGKGIAAAIILHCQRQAEKQNITRFECFASLNAEGFYKKQGFSVLKHYNGIIRNQIEFPMIHMEKVF